MKLDPKSALAQLAKPAVVRPQRDPFVAGIMARDRGLDAIREAIDAAEAPSTPNLREHWTVRAKRAKKQRAQGKRLAAEALPSPKALLFVTLTRVAPRRLDDDNWVASAKNIRDGIADYLRIDDASPLVHWSYLQRKGPAAVEVHITENPF